MYLQLDHVPLVPPDTVVLDLRFNKIREIKSRTFENLRNLNTLLLNNNHLSRIENYAFAGLPDLRYLYLYKNKIKTIGKTAFKGLTKLEQLYIHFNKIDKLEPDLFSDLISLERLFLHNNQLSKIPSNAFDSLKSLRRLRLDSNALVCDCEILWLAEMLREKNSSTQAAVTCEHPKHLQGKSLVALNHANFRCKKPELIEEPNDVDISFGGTAYFHCKAEGDPQPDIVWMHNSNTILPDQEERFTILKDGTLMITDTKDLDEGVYECMAKSPVGETRSRRAKMHYLNLKDSNKAILTFTERPRDVRAAVGSTITLRCGASGDPQPNISWTQNSQSLPHAFRYHVSQSGTLTIKNSQRGDAGVYRCVASNRLMSIAEEAKVIIESPPVFLERPRDQEALEGNPVELVCLVEGNPAPILSWTKDGLLVETGLGVKFLKDTSVLRIDQVNKKHEGIYTCTAENESGHRNSSALLMIRQNVPPVFSRSPENQLAYVGSSIELPCHAKGQPTPVIKWQKGVEIMNPESDHHRINIHGDLYMFNIRKGDEGVYECIAENEVGSSRVSMTLTVSDGPIAGRPGDYYIYSAVDEAQRNVDDALNRTIFELFGDHHNRSPGELLEAFRFPVGEARQSARASAIYERALEIVWNHVQSGADFNLSAFTHANLLSTQKLDLLANLSGCLVHKAEPSCSEMCIHRNYRSFDGSCNNFNHPTWGASLTSFVRLLSPQYENGFNTPIGWSKSKLYNGFPKPSARAVSTEIVSTDFVSHDTAFTHMLMQWGQFLDHDLDFSMPSISHASFVDAVDCATSCEAVAPCFPIEVPPNDKRIEKHRCMEFVRSSTLCGSGMTSVFFNKLQPREQLNQLTAFLDASNVYGSNQRVAQHLREMSSNRGLLRTGVLMSTGKPLLPFNDGQPIDCKRDLTESSIDCFLAGDVRANEQLGLLTMHTLWVREHNRIAKELYSYNPHWDNDKIYHEARKIVGATMQHITYAHWLPKVLGKNFFSKLGAYKGYNASTNPSIANVFATAALRFGHTLINPELMRLNASFQPIPEGNLPLRKAFFAPFRLLEEGGIDPLMRGLLYAAAKLKKPDQLLNSDLTEHLFTPAHLVAQDLAALNIQRGRDHGLPSYNEWRKHCGLKAARTFADFQNEIKDPVLLRKLERLYGHPDNIDIWVGGISEESLEDAKVGPTFLCLLLDQFKRTREGDRFWYENPGIFTSDQLNQIKQTSLARVICDNGDNITNITADVFTMPHLQNPNFIKCFEIPKIQLNVWTECCQECQASARESLINIIQPPRQSFIERTEDNFYTLNDQPKLNFSSNTIQNRDLDITEERIEGIEELIGKMEKTIQRLGRKVRKLENEHYIQKSGSCLDSEKKLRSSGESWSKDSCTKCHCQANQLTCWVDTCPPSQCENPKYLEDQCCPVC